jgi:3-dehydroquinate dehydratase
MNLLGLKEATKELRLTLDKVNRAIKAEAKNKNVNLSIVQSHSESKIVSLIQKNRTRLSHIVIAPGPWCQNGFILKDVLSIINIPFSLVLDNDDETIFHSIADRSCVYISRNYIDAYIESIKSL